MKQTAVEWLIEQWPVLESQLPSWLIEQAKAMEKEQIIETARYYFHERGKLTPEQYYKETYERNE